MLEKVKKFVKSVSTTTWILVGIGVITAVVLWAASNHSKKHHKHEDHKPAAVEAPAAK